MPSKPAASPLNFPIPNLNNKNPMIKALTAEEQAAGPAVGADYKNAVDLLAILSEAQNRLDDLQGQANAEFLECIDGHRPDYARLQSLIAQTTEGLEVLARRHPEWFTEGKTVKTPYGSVSLKDNPPKLEVKNEELTILLIEQAGADEKFVRQVKQLNLDALGELPDDELAKFRIKRVKTDRFEAKPAKVDMGKAVKDAEKKKGK